MTMIYTIDEQIAEVRREIGMRMHVYPRFIADGKLTKAHADERIAMLEAVRKTLETVRDERQAKVAPGLFP